MSDFRPLVLENGVHQNLHGPDALVVDILKLGPGAAGAGLAPFKIDPGVLQSAPESGAVESDGVHIYWTDALGARHALDTGGGGGSETLAQAYNLGGVAADQTLTLKDANGGTFIVDGTDAGFSGTYAMQVKGAGLGLVNFPRVGGLSVVSAISAAAPGAAWNAVNFAASTLTLTGGPATATAVAQVHVGAAVVNGAGNTVTDAYNVLFDAAPAGTATITRGWSLGAAGAVQFGAGLVLGTALAPPGESDLVFGAGATNVSAAHTARLGYLAAPTEQLMVSANGGAYVPLLYGPGAGGFTQGSVPFADASGQLAQDNTHLFWDATNATLRLGGAGANATSALSLSTSKTLASPAAGSIWDGLRVENSTLTATMGAGNVTVTELVSAHFHQPTITTGGGAGLLTVTDAYTVRIGAPPIGAGSATLTNAWSLGVTGAVRLLSLLLVNPAPVSSGTFTGVTQVAAAHTNLTASAEVPDTNFNLSATKTWATGAITTQRDFLVQARTYAFAAASTVTTAATLAITNAPQVGANATITNAYALWTQAGATQLDGGSYAPSAGTKSQLGVTATFAPTSGTAVFNVSSLAYTINQTGGANGTITGILVNATETAVVGTHNLLNLQVASVSRHLIDRFGNTAITQAAETGQVPTALSITGGAHTTITASAEDIGAKFNFSASKQWATGAITTQREILFQAPTYAFVGNSTIATAATVAITGAPSAGAHATITQNYALWVQSGNVCIGDRLVVGAAINPQAPFHVEASNGTVFSATDSQVTSSTATLYLNNEDSSANSFAQLVFHTSRSFGDGYVRLVAVGTASGTADCVICTSNAGNINSSVRILGNGNVGIGTGLTPAAASTLHVVASQSVVAASGAAWNGVNFAASTLTLTGSTTPVTTLNFATIVGPTVTAASAVVTTDFFTCRIGTATFTGAGPASATRNWSLGVDGNTLFGAAWACTPNAITADAGGSQAAGVTTVNTEVTTDGDANLDNVPLANGAFVGQVRHIYCKAQGNVGDSFKITPTTLVGGTQITFATPLGRGAGFVWTAAGWVCFANNGGVIS